MKLELQGAAIHLAPRGLFKVVDGAGSTLCAQHGALWITEQDSPRDVVLEPGDCHRLRQPGLALISALGGEATFHFNTWS